MQREDGHDEKNNTSKEILLIQVNIVQHEAFIMLPGSAFLP